MFSRNHNWNGISVVASSRIADGLRVCTVLAAMIVLFVCAAGPASASPITVTLQPWNGNDSNAVFVESSGELGQGIIPHLGATFRNLEDHAISFDIMWRDRNALEQWLCADILTITGLTGSKIALEMDYDENVYNPPMDQVWALTGEETIYVLTGNPAYAGGWQSLWSVNNASGVFPMPANPWPSNGVWNFQGTFAEAYAAYGSGATVLGAFGVDPDVNMVWAVINQDGSYAPEPGTMLILAAGAAAILRRRRSA